MKHFLLIEEMEVFPRSSEELPTFLLQSKLLPTTEHSTAEEVKCLFKELLPYNTGTYDSSIRITPSGSVS